MAISRIQKISDFYRQNRRMPSYAEIMRLMGFKSKNSAYKLVANYLSEGILEKDGQGKLIPKKLLGMISVLGSVEAGFPSPAEEELTDTMNLDEYLIGNREATYLLKVSGDSMIEAGIMPGDMVLVERRTDARNGDIVIAEIDTGWTMKYLRKDKGKTWLEAGNVKYPPIIPKNELKIAAIVKAVVRKY